MNVPASRTPIVAQLYKDTRTTSLTPLPSPVLDARDEAQVLEDAIATVRAASKQKLTDFSEGSVARALLAGHTLVQSKIAYTANQFAQKVAVDWLQIAGVQKVSGVAATTNLEVTLTGALSTDFTLSAGFEVRAGTSLVYRTTALLIIKSGDVTGTVGATCAQPGSQGNVSARTISSPAVSVAFLKSITNPLPVVNGSDGETTDETITRGFTSLRTRGLVTVDDYETLVRSALGSTTVVRAYGGISLQGAPTDAPTVIVAVCQRSGEPIGDTARARLQSTLDELGHATVTHNIKDIVPLQLDVRVQADFPVTADVPTAASAIAAAIQNYVTPSTRWVDARLEQNELVHVAREAGGEMIGWGVYLAETGQPIVSSLAVSGIFETLSVNTVVVEAAQGGAVRIFPFGPGDPD